MSMPNHLLKIQSKLCREIAKLIRYRPTSFPYISGDGFRSIADHIYDETSKCKAANIKAGNIVFLKTDMMKDWFVNVHPMIPEKYILITHNSDGIVGKNESMYIDNKIIRWYAQNNVYKHEKITPIPIGVENKALYMSGWMLLKLLNELRRQKMETVNRILFGFNVNTNTTERTLALDTLRKCSSADEIMTRLNLKEYFQLLNQYRFVASPEGNGPDCHRTWEALYLGTIPIVRNSPFMKSFTSLGLPIQIIENWNTLETFGNIVLRVDTQQPKPRDMANALFMDYWINIINKNRTKH